MFIGEEMKCEYCEMSKESDSFWEIHQTMSDGSIWCVKFSSKRVDEMTKLIINRYKSQIKETYGNKKRHRQ